MKKILFILFILINTSTFSQSYLRLKGGKLNIGALQKVDAGIGENWYKVTNQLNAATTTLFFGPYHDSIMLMTNNLGYLWRSHDYGATWTQTAKYGSIISNTAFNFHDTLYLLSNLIIRTIDFGLHVDTVGIKLPGIEFNGVQNSQGVGISGSKNPAYFIRTRNYGRSWDTLQLSRYGIGTETALGVIGTELCINDSVFIFGTGNNAANNSGYILKSSDYGATFKISQKLYRLGTQAVRSLCYAPPCVYASTLNGYAGSPSWLFKSSNYGTTFDSVFYVPSPQSTLTSVTWDGNSTIIMGTGTLNVTDGSYVIRSTNNGISWSNLGQKYPGQLINNFYFLSKNKILGFIYSQGKMVLSKDNGDNWKVITDVVHYHSFIKKVKSSIYLSSLGNGSSCTILRSLPLYSPK